MGSIGLRHTLPALLNSSTASAVPKKCSDLKRAVVALRENRTAIGHVAVRPEFLVLALPVIAGFYPPRHCAVQ
jgi:hypothetical protein